MIKKTLILISIILLISHPAAAILYSDYKRVNQTQSIKLSEPGKYIGAIKILDIKPLSVENISVKTDQYDLTMNFSTEVYWLIFERRKINLTYIDYATGTAHQDEFYTNKLYTDASLQLPQFWYYLTTNNLKIIPYNIFWRETEKQGLSSLYFLTHITNISTPIPTISTATINIIGSDKVDIEYYVGTKEQMLDAASTDAKEDWYQFILKNIPFIGNYLYESITLIVAFIGFAFLLMGFLVTNPVLIYLTFLCFSLMKGIFIMVRGGNVVELIISVVTDHVNFAKFVIYIFVEIVGIIWRIVQALGSLLQGIKPI